MRDNPLIVSLLSGLILILIVAGVSLLFQLNRTSEKYDLVLAEKLEIERNSEEIKTRKSRLKKELDDLQKEIGDLKETMSQVKDGHAGKVASLQMEIGALKEDVLRLENVKDKLENALKDELMKRQLKE